MAVYERTWRRWTGAPTARWSRWTVLTRYALAEAFSSRLFTAFFGLSFLPTLLGLVFVYLSHNLGPLAALGISAEAMDRFAMSYIRSLFIMQAVPAFFITVLAAPPLLSSDLVHGGLPLYLARPISRWEYLLGKAGVLAVLLSPPTWLAGLTVFTVKSFLAGDGWWRDNIRLGLGFVLGHGVWIVVISAVAFAITTVVRYRWAARGALFGLFFVLWGFSAAVNLVTGSQWGSLLSLTYDIRIVVQGIFGTPPEDALPTAACLATLGLVVGGCLALIARALRAHEEVR